MTNPRDERDASSTPWCPSAMPSSSHSLFDLDLRRPLSTPSLPSYLLPQHRALTRAAGIIGTALPSIEKALGSGFENSPTQQGVLTVSILVGAMIASAFGGVVANILGRRYATILLGAWAGVMRSGT